MEKGTSGSGAFFAKKVDVNGTVGCFEDDTACDGWFGAVDLGHDVREYYEGVECDRERLKRRR